MSAIHSLNRAKLLANRYVASLTEKHINYTLAFKRHALQESRRGVTAAQIWREAGFDTSNFRSDYFRKCLIRWGTQEQHSFELRKRGRSTDVFLNRDEEMAFLRAENAILKELHALGVDGPIQSTGLSLELFRQISNSHLLDSVNWAELAREAITSGWCDLAEDSPK